MNKIIIVLLIVVLAGAGGYFLIQKDKTEIPKTGMKTEEATSTEEVVNPNPTTPPAAKQQDEARPSGAASPSPAASEPSPAPETPPAETKTFNVAGKSFSFTPSQIKVKQGDRVKIVFTSEDAFHDWRLDAFSAATAVITTGQTAVVEFTADKTGTFEYYCSVGSHRAMGMRGNLVVE